MWWNRKLDINRTKDRNLFSTEVIAVTGLSLVSVAGFARITNRLVKNELNPFRTDIKVMNFLSTLESPQMTKFMRVITSLSSVQVLPIIAGGFSSFFFLYRNKSIKSFDVPVISIGSALLNLLFKEKYKRTRPVQNEIKVSGWSYPSGHAMESMSFYGFLLYLTLKSKALPYIKVSISSALAALIGLIGVSRSYLKVHYPSDVIAGFAVGFVWLMGSIGLTKGLELVVKK